MDNKEKIEEVLKIIREKGSDPSNYSPSLLLGEIQKILESDEDDGWTPGVVGERTDKEGNKY